MGLLENFLEKTSGQFFERRYILFLEKFLENSLEKMFGSFFESFFEGIFECSLEGMYNRWGFSRKGSRKNC